MNKYQEALDIITMRFDDINSMDRYYLKPTTSIATLQELIDNYTKYEKAFDRACELLASVEKDGCYYCPLAHRGDSLYDIKQRCITKNDDCTEEDWHNYLTKEN